MDPAHGGSAGSIVISMVIFVITRTLAGYFTFIRGSVFAT